MGALGRMKRKLINGKDARLKQRFLIASNFKLDQIIRAKEKEKEKDSPDAKLDPTAITKF